VEGREDRQLRISGLGGNSMGGKEGGVGKTNRGRPHLRCWCYWYCCFHSHRGPS
jgi:hypothetical protein